MTPKLRFKQTGGIDFPAWEGVLLRDIAKIITDKNKFGKIIRVLTNSAVDGVIDQRDFFEKDIANKNNLSGYYIVELGDYVYNPRISTSAPVGPISKNKVGVGIMSPLYTVFRFFNQNNDFFEQYFKTAHWHKHMRSISNSGARHDRMSITINEFLDLPLPCPHPAEQQKIAATLTSLDDLIAAQAEKVKALQAHKKGLMQQLFPAEGERVPRVRFPEFEGEWEESVLKDVCQMQAGKFIPASEINEFQNEGQNPCYGGNGLRGYTKSFTHIGEYPLIGRQGALCGNVTLAFGKFHATEHAVVATPKVNIDTYWLFYMLIVLNLNQYATGQAQPGLSVESLEKLGIKVPRSINEQQKIAALLTSLDDLITVHNQKLEVLKAHKKGLMQQMFPASHQEAL